MTTDLARPLVSPVFDTLKELEPIVQETITPIAALAGSTLPLLAHALAIIGPAIAPVIDGFIGMKVVQGVASLVDLLSGSLGILAVKLPEIAVGSHSFNTALGNGAAEVGGFSDGLAGLAGPLAVGAAGASVAAANFDQMGESVGATAQGTLGMVAAGALLGFALGTLTGVGAPVGAVLGGLAGGVAALTVSLTNGGPGVEAYRKEFQDLAPAIDKATTATQAYAIFRSKLGDLDRQQSDLGTNGSIISDELTALSEKSPDAAQKVISAYRSIAEARLAAEPKWDTDGVAIIESQIKGLDDLSAKLQHKAIVEADAAGKSAAANAQVTDATNQSADATRAFALLTDVTTRSMAENSVQAKASADAQNAAVSVSVALASAQHTTAEATHDAAEQYALGAANASDYKTAMDVLNQGTIDVASAQQQAAAASTSLNGALVGNGLTLDITTEAGNKNEASLIALIRANEGVATAQAATDRTGASSAVTMSLLRDRLGEIRDALPDDADKAQVQTMIDKLTQFGNPPPPPVALKVDGSQVDPVVQHAREALFGYGLAHPTASLDADGSEVPQKVQNAVAFLTFFNSVVGTGTVKVNDDDKKKVKDAEGVIDDYAKKEATAKIKVDNSDANDRIDTTHRKLDDLPPDVYLHDPRHDGGHAEEVDGRLGVHRRGRRHRSRLRYGHRPGDADPRRVRALARHALPGGAVRYRPRSCERRVGLGSVPQFFGWSGILPRCPR